MRCKVKPFSPVRLLDLAPVPTFNLSVDLPTKSLNVTVEPGEAVYARWCYKSNADCMGEDGSTQVTVRTSCTLMHCHALWIFLLCLMCLYGLLRSIRLGLHQLSSTSPTFCPVSVCRYFMSIFYFLNADALWILFWWLISMPILSYLCCQVYYKYTDSARKIKCPFEDQSLAGEC